MIIANLQDSRRIELLHPQFAELFAYIKSHSWDKAPLGRISLDGDNLYINHSVPIIKSRDTQVLEVHRRYIDVHVLLEGRETFGWNSLANLKEPVAAYDPEKECQFFADRPHSYVDLVPGEFVIVFPEDAHAPNISDAPLRKLVAKILL